MRIGLFFFTHFCRLLLLSLLPVGCCSLCVSRCVVLCRVCIAMLCCVVVDVLGVLSRVVCLDRLHQGISLFCLRILPRPSADNIRQPLREGAQLPPETWSWQLASSRHDSAFPPSASPFGNVNCRRMPTLHWNVNTASELSSESQLSVCVWSTVESCSDLSSLARCITSRAPAQDAWREMNLDLEKFQRDSSLRVSDLEDRSDEKGGQHFPF